jgi:hypothetical protein
MDQQVTRALLPQSPYKKRSLKSYHIKYFGMFFVILMMLSAIRVFVNYATIQSSIQQVVQETWSLFRQKQYAQIQAYVYTLPESRNFISHDNGIVLPWERVFVIVPWTGDVSTWMQNNVIETKVEDTIEKKLSPFASWIVYFGQKMNK